jgi:hypothetical protein
MRAKEFLPETVSTGLGGGSAGSNGGQMVGGPTTYEQEFNKFKRRGPRRITAMTTEALDSSYPYEGNAIGGRYTFETEDGVFYKVYFGGQDLVEISFSAILPGDEEKFRPEKTTMTGTGNARKVFGTIVKIVQEYVEVQQPSALYFTADKDERGRVNLYKTLAARVDTALPNYVDAGPTDLGSGVAFMIRRKEDINEVADKPYDYIQNVRTPEKRAYRFQTDDGNLYRVQVFNRRSDNENKLEIHFDLTDMSTGKPNAGKTGTGDSIRVFGTVANILQKEVQDQKPTGVIIASKADDESRLKLYRTLARRATKLMPDYEVSGERTVTGGDGNQYITIELKRKEAVNEKWSKKYKSSINCNNPKGFSQRAHCQGRKKK